MVTMAETMREAVTRTCAKCSALARRRHSGARPPREVGLGGGSGRGRTGTSFAGILPEVKMPSRVAPMKLMAATRPLV